MKLLYFAWIRVKMGTSNESVDPPSTVENVQSLIDWMTRVILFQVKHFLI